MKKQRLQPLCYLAITLFCLSVYTSVLADTFTQTVSGVSGDALTNSEMQLAIARDKYPQNVNEQTAQTLYQKGPTIIEQAIAPFGYFSPQINASLAHNNDHWIAHYLVDPGPKLPVHHIDIEIKGPGKDDPALMQIKAHALAITGQHFSTKRYHELEQFIFSALHRNGYINAKLTQNDINIDLTTYQATICFQISTGKQYHFGQFKFTEDKYDPAFLQKFIPMSPGEIYSPQQLQTLQSTLTNTKYFTAVNITPNIEDTKDPTIPVTIDTKAVPSKVYNFGWGYGTNTGMRTSIGTQFNRLTNTGQHMSIALNLSEVNTALLTQYFIPGPNPTRNQYVINGLIQEFEPPGGDAYSKSLSPGYITELNHTTTLHSSINYLNERYSIENAPYDTADMLYPELNITHKVSDHPVNPTAGYSVGLQLRGSHIATPTTFHQESLTTKWLHKTSSNNLLMLHGQLGTTSANDFEQLPMTLRYFAGGVNSVRGYGAQSLGPGKYLKIVSLEFQQRLRQNIYSAFYLDAGNATDHFHEAMDKGRGTGLVWHSPIGQVALYVTQAYTEEDKPLRIDISIGAGL